MIRHLKTLTLTVIILTIAIRDNAQDSTGYTTTLKAFSTFYQNDQPDSIYTLFADGMKKAIPAASWRQAFTAIHSQLGSLGPFTRMQAGPTFVNFTAPASSDPSLLQLSIDTNYHIQGLFKVPVHSSSPTNFSIKTGGASLAATLTLPDNDSATHTGNTTLPDSVRQKIPVALIIAGSGPVDRDGNSLPAFQTNSYKSLAEQLKQKGIATLRYDKRYIGESKGFTQPIKNLIIEDYIKDARTAIQALKTDPRFSSVTVIGHSEGALIGLIAAIPNTADKYISLAGAGDNASDLLKRQLSALFPQAKDSIDRLLDSLTTGLTVMPPPIETSPWAQFFSPTVQRYLSSWFQYEPSLEIRRLQIPILIVQGGKDQNVTEKDAKLLKAAVPAATLLIIPTMTHMLKDTDTDPNVNQQMIEAITQFITQK